MSLSSGFITRPIATALMMVAVVALGIVSYVLLPVAALPNIDTPTIQVTAQMPGADPQTMASSVATQLERQFGQIPGLTQMTSSSGTGFTSITLQFDRSRTVNSAAQDVQAAINATQAQLPISLLSLPIYRKTNPADTPILLISLTSDVLPIMTVSDYAYSVLAQKLSQVPGVGLVTVGGNESPAIRIQLNPAQLAAMSLDFETIRLALASLTVVQPTGLLYGGQQAVALQTNDQLLTTQGYDDAIVAYRNGGPIRIRDIGRAIKAPQDKTVAGWLNGKPAVLLAVFRTPGANVMSAVEAIKKALPQLRASLPPGIDVEIVSDRTQTIAASLADVRFTLLLTIALVVGVIALFLRKLWATVIPAISVPISIIGTFAVMYVLGYSLDNLSLMALTIAVGFVVDDAIVMVENIVRHIEGGVSPLQAALDGAGEIGFTILSISISLIAVFIPLFLMGGVVGLLFREFAVTVAVSIVVSVLVSLTLTPMLCAKLLPAAAHGKEGRISRALEAFLTGLVTVYDRALVVALRHRRTTLGVMIATVAATGWLFVVIPKGFFPQQDTGIIMGVSEAAQDVSPDGMKERQQAILEIAARDPAVASAVGYIGPGGPTVTENDGRVFITLKPHSERNVTADQVIARLTTAVQQVQGMRLYMQAAQDITIGSRLSKTQYQYTLVDIDQDELNFYAQKLMAKLQELPELTAVASDQEAPGQTLKVEIDRAAAALFGITPATIDDTLYDAFGQRHIARIYTALNEYYVILEVNPQYQLGPNALQRIYVLSQKWHNGAVEPDRQPDAGRCPSRGQSSGPVSVGHPELQSRAGRDDRRRGFSGAKGYPRASLTAIDSHQFPGQRAGLPKLAQHHAPADPRGLVRGLHHSWHALREHDPSIDDSVDSAFGWSRRTPHVDAGRPAARCDWDYRHYPVDRHREEERHHACRRRPRGAAPSGPFLRGRDPSRLPPPLPAYSDDDHVCAVRRHPSHARNRNGVRNPATAGLCDRRRIAGVASAHALHDADCIHLHGQDRSGLVGPESRQALRSGQRDAGRLIDGRKTVGAADRAVTPAVVDTAVGRIVFWKSDIFLPKMQNDGLVLKNGLLAARARVPN